jgi:hypothetical protein
MRFVPAATVRPHRPTRRSLGSVQLEDGSSRGLEQYLRVFRRQSTPYGCGPGFRPFRLLLAPDMRCTKSTHLVCWPARAQCPQHADACLRALGTQF